MISSARKPNTTNPFIIYDFYDQLERIFQQNPEIDAKKIWNCDEAGFPTDQTHGKVISMQGKQEYKLSFGARHENITV